MSIVRRVGLELETEGKCPDELPSADYWEYHSEGSLRGRHTEFVLSRPMRDPEVSSALSELSTLIRRGVQLSERTSLHVHVDVTDLNRQQIYSVCLAYILFERPLYEISGGRNYSKYCIPVYMSHFLQRAVATLATGENIVTTDYRYGGLNLNSISKFNSLEFRMHAGSLDTRDISSWTKILHDLVENTKDRKPADILEYAMNVESISSLASEVFSEGSMVSAVLATNSDSIGQSIKTAEQVHLMALREGYKDV